MLTFLSKKPKVEYVVPEFFKDWANSGAELEALGRRLDAVRGIIAELEAREDGGGWALNHWRDAEAVILRKWRQVVLLKDTGLRQRSVLRDGPEIDYSWWEKHDGIGGPAFPILGIFDSWFNRPNLAWSWEKAINEKLQKARLGLA